MWAWHGRSTSHPLNVNGGFSRRFYETGEAGEFRIPGIAGMRMAQKIRAKKFQNWILKNVR